MKLVEVGLTEQILTLRKRDRDLHQQVKEIQKPRLEWPKGSHKSQLQIAGAADLGKHLLDKAERKEGVSLKMIPGLDQGIYRRRLRIRHWGKIHLEAMVEGGGEQIHSDWPKAEKFTTHILMKSPLRAEDPPTSTESVCQDVQATRNKLGEQTNIGVLAEAKDGLSHRVER